MRAQDFFKQLQAIEADPATRAVSRMHILATPQNMPRSWYWNVSTHFARLTLAGVTAAVFVFLIIGALPATYFGQSSPENQDTSALYAEAQAVDIQINLSGLIYDRTTSITTTTTPPLPTSTLRTIARLKNPTPTPDKTVQNSAQPTTEEPKTSEDTPIVAPTAQEEPLTLDDILIELAQ